MQWTPKNQRVEYPSNQKLLPHISIEKISSIHKFILKIQQIFGSHEIKSLGHFLTTPTQTSLNQLLAFLNLYQHAKNQFLPSVHSSDRVNFRAPSPNWPVPFSTMLTPNIFTHLLICLNLRQHAKN